MSMRFNYKKYRKWRKDREHLDDQTLDMIEEFNNYKDLDGLTYDEIWKNNRIILKEWCDNGRNTKK